MVRKSSRTSPGSSPSEGADQEQIDYTECLEQIKKILQNPTLIQSDAFQIGCVKDADGITTALISTCKKTDADGNIVGWTNFIHPFNGDPASVYTGPFEDCDPPLPQVHISTHCY